MRHFWRHWRNFASICKIAFCIARLQRQLKMSFKTPPPPKDVQELQFKQSSNHQIAENFTSVPPNCNLVAADGKRGLLYVGHKNKITVLKLGNEANIEWKIDLELPDIISRLSLSCDFSYLAVALSAPAALIYSAASLSKNVLELLHEIRLSTSNGDITVLDLRWNPAVPGMLCTVASDFTIGSFQIKGEGKGGVGLTALERIEGIEALCVAWSPKGKQIAVGCRNGNIIQLKPELKLARTIPGPNPYIGGVTAILWLSNYQFCAAYLEPGEQKIYVMIVDMPKGETIASFTNYEDITYGGNPTTRYYFDCIPEWGVILAASSTSSEIAVLGTIDNGNSWEQWQLVDSGRAELPLVRTDESFPVGLAIDRSTNNILPWGPESTLPNPVPILHILGTSGQLCSFHIVNLKPACPAICYPPSEIVAAPPVQAALPGSRPSVASSEISFNLTTGATSTPRPKVDSPKEKPKNVMMTNFFVETTKTPAFAPRTEPTIPPINPPAPLPQIETKIPSFVQQPETKPTNFALQDAIKIPKPRIEMVEAQPKIKAKLPERKETPQESIPQEKPTLDESLCLRAYREEQINFEKELKSRLEPVNWECGTNAEKEQLVEKTALIEDFLRDLQDTTTSLSSDIAYLKALLLQSFAWLEETKSKNSVGLKLGSRNRRENSKLAEIQRFFYYTQSQLVQASKALDLQWSEQQSKEQKKMKIPNMEFIYQSLMRHGQILSKEKTNIENLVKKWRTLGRGGKVSGLNQSLSNLHISTSSNFGTDSAIDFRCRAIAAKSQSFSREKQIKLRDLLSESTPRIVKPAKPTLIQDRLEATLSSLASMSPVKVSKPKVEQKLSQKPKVQSPLTSLNNIVSKIGASAKEPETNLQLQKMVPTFAPKSTPPLNMSTLVPQKPKVNTSFQNPSQLIQNQQVQHTQPTQPTQLIQHIQSQKTSQASNLMKPFSKVDSISFGHKPEEKNLQKEMPKAEKESTLFSKTVSEILTSQPPVIKIPSSIPGTNFQGINIEPISPPPVQSTFSLQPKVSLPSSIAAQTFSFDSKPPANLAAFLLPSKPEEKSNLDLGGLNLSLQSPGLSISLVPESKAVSSPQVTPAMSSINFGNALAVSKSSTVFGQASSTTNVFGAAGAQSGTQGSIFGISQRSIFGGSSNFGSAASTGVATQASAPSGIFTSNSSISVPSSVAVSSSFPVSSSVPSPAPVSSSVIVPKPTSITSPTSLISSTPVSSPSSATSSISLSNPIASPTSVLSHTSVLSPTSVGAPTSGSVQTPVSSPTSVPVASPPPAYGATSPPSTASGPNLLSLSLGSPKPSSTPTTSPLVSSVFSTPAFGTSKVASSASTLNFGTATCLSSGTTITPVFGKEPTSTPGSIFGGSSTISSGGGNNLFGGNVGTPAANPFGGNTLAQSQSSTSIFGSATTSPGGSIFGGGTTNTAGAAFGMKTPATGSVFGSSSQNSVFGAPAGASLFGGGTAKPQETSFSMFGGSALGGTTTSAFGQAPAFGTKPAFGASPEFGQAKPAFGSGFGSSVFGSSPASAGFGSPPMMGGSPPALSSNPMQKVFGGSSGSNTFESLATQSGGLSFSSLAQTSPEQQQQQQQQQQQKPPEFAAKSSFSSWR